jgi:hypothetical protein
MSNLAEIVPLSCILSPLPEELIIHPNIKITAISLQHFWHYSWPNKEHRAALSF